MLPSHMDLFAPSALFASTEQCKPNPASNLCLAFLPLCFHNDMNCSPRNPHVLITIQNTLPYTPQSSKIPSSRKALTGRKYHIAGSLALDESDELVENFGTCRAV